MKALIVGLGSMGKRRIRLLKGIDPTVEIIGVDMTAERRGQVEEMGHKTYTSIAEAAKENPDVAFVCTAPVAHYVIIKELLENKQVRDFIDVDSSPPDTPSIAIASRTRVISRATPVSLIC